MSFIAFLLLLLPRLLTSGTIGVPSFSPEFLIASPSTVGDSEKRSPRPGRSLVDRSVDWPTWDQWERTLRLRDYNSRIVLFGAGLLGAAAGLVGSFMLLRKRALMGDAVSHATLPGIGFAFMLAIAWGHSGKSLPGLLMGASAAGLAGVLAVSAIRKLTRLKEDAALGIVLSVFFGAGISLLGVIQQMQTGHAAGLEAFIYGKAASMSAVDAQLIAAAAGISLILCVLFFKELKLLCFDEAYAGSRGFPVALLDLLLMLLVVLVCIVGLQAVGLVLVIALLVIPAAAARFWTDAMARLAVLAAGMGAVGGMAGAALSALFPKLPSGAMIVLFCSAMFFVSMVFGTRRGILVQAWRRSRFNSLVDRANLLLDVRELSRPGKAGEAYSTPIVSERRLRDRRGWPSRKLHRVFDAAFRERLVQGDLQAGLALTLAGQAEAARIHREFDLPELHVADGPDEAVHDSTGRKTGILGSPEGPCPS